MTLAADLQWKEPYVSRGINRKASGVLEAGVYWGFAVTPGPGLTVSVSPAEDWAESVAVLDRNGFSVTVRSGGVETVPVVAGEWLLVIEVDYAIQCQTAALLKLVPTAADHHVVLARLTIPVGATAVTAEMIDVSVRQEAGPALRAAQFAAALSAQAAALVDTQIQLAQLLAWASANGFTPPSMSV